MALALADVILVAHFAIAVFITLGFIIIPLGAILGWQWVRRRRLRQLHLGAISFVALEALAGIACPLTGWEDALRARAPGEAGFVERWVSRFLYYDMPSSFFLIVYLAAAILAWMFWLWVAPQPAKRG